MLQVWKKGDEFYYNTEERLIENLLNSTIFYGKNINISKIFVWWKIICGVNSYAVIKSKETTKKRNDFTN